jgi:hypothetical protein
MGQTPYDTGVIHGRFQILYNDHHDYVPPVVAELLKRWEIAQRLKTLG